MRARLVLALLFSSATAVAQATTGPGEQAFREGRALMQSGDYAAACARFAESQRLEPAPGTLLNIGQCEDKQGHLLAARDAFERAAASYAPGDRRRTFALDQALAVEKRIPKLVVKLASGAPVSTTVRSGATRIELDRAQLMDPGEVVLTVSAPGRQTQRVTVILREGQTHELAVEPGGEAGPPKPGVTAPASSTATASTSTSTGTRGERGSTRTIGFVVGGVGVAGLVVGAVTGIAAMGKASTVEEHCDANMACDPEGLEAASSGDTLALVSTISFAVGLAGVAAGSVLVLTSPRSRETHAHAQRRSITIAPSIDDRRAGLVLRGAF
jgi:hypothetical protein